MAEVRRTRLCDDTYVFFRDDFSVVLVVDAENLYQSLILAAIKEYSLYASVVKLVIIPLKFLTSLCCVLGGSIPSIDYFTSVDRGHETKIM